MIFYLN